ncbi:ATP-dependent sacrificial sulfur transferase LarE [Blastopirellula sp. JC732]|uniref:ATP-dependent sacrificial sulfur transferase LarE n=1 Tax=Blastopirellula sediminis TaxID=2894196 RepID=A0A9X1MRR7_9BACT|nr:ATP-dependent sacrificial sulfur transferase LarE [Blastopirellula sediminis]MCC9605266.1 ATP-dependent sacrificial sulfur transferase LarE [Blastopirellula sediminis]MCC9631434.1 ATP-dependent sacrificial sulfur transferase LarE [Blastopirellula sediminis]
MKLADQLVQTIATYQSCAVAFSGGVDSAVVAKAAFLALGESAVAITARSPSVPRNEIEEAIRVAAEIGIRHEIVDTQETTNPLYIQNAPDRCFHCKTELYSQIELLVSAIDAPLIINGANVDDQGDHRPGMIAAQNHQVRSPLIECGLTKADVRALAQHWNLSVHDKPASPCLASRIAYGEEATPERLAMIEAAEDFLRARGLREFRVRYHRGDIARIEVTPERIAELATDPLRTELASKLRELGFRAVTLDLEGFRSGNLNGFVDLSAVRLQ